MSAFVREIKVLGSFKNHEDIVNILGIAWEISGGDLRPVLALEFAQHNSLAKFWLSNDFMTLKEKRALCLDIGNGLNALHELGFIWGDCKPENVLICQDPSDPTAWKAKLNDFGATIFLPDQNVGFVAYSPPWIAPEAHSAKGSSALQTAEIYAYGMLFWAIHLDGLQFSRNLWKESFHAGGRPLAGQSDESENLTAGDIQMMKAQSVFRDNVIQVLRFYLDQRMRSSISSPGPESEMNRIINVVKATMSEVPAQRWQKMSTVLQKISSANISHRSHDAVAKANAPVAALVSNLHDARDCDSLDIEQLFTTYEPTGHLSQVSEAIYNRLVEYSQAQRSPRAFFLLSICCLVGFGTDCDKAQAVYFMRTAASLGNEAAQGLYATLRSFRNVSDLSVGLLVDDSEVTDNDCANWQWSAVSQGSRYASKTLKATDIGVWQCARDNFRSEHIWIDYATPDCRDSLHWAAARGHIEELTRLLKSGNPMIEQRNPWGETALLAAARTGHMEALKTLIEKGASRDVVDDRGVSILHWLISLDDNEVEALQSTLPISRLRSCSSVRIHLSEQHGAAFDPGTALDWAVDARHNPAINMLLNLGADCSIETDGRPSALCRAAARHDWEILSLLIEQNPRRAEVLQVVDSHGLTCIAYALKPTFLLDRTLINQGSDAGLSNTLNVLLRYRVDIHAVNTYGESAIYSTIKLQDNTSVRRVCDAIYNRCNLASDIIGESGPNQWSPLRRALYANEIGVFHSLITKVTHGAKTKIAHGSKDGLTLLHELAFLPTDSGISFAQCLSDMGYLPDLIHRRTSTYMQRSSLTPFQLAVLLQKFKLADFLVACGANPLDGVDKGRFLGYLISYQLNDAYDISTFVCAILEDPVVNTIRRFPASSSVQPSIKYLLDNEAKWWRKTKQSIERDPFQSQKFSRWWYKMKQLSHWDPFQDRWYYDFDRDVDHDPMIARAPGITSVYRSVMGSMDNREAENVTRSGYSGVLDANEAGFWIRHIHAREYGSFLIKYRRDGALEQKNGHRYVTALELAFDVCIQRPASRDAEQIFYRILGTFNGPRHCNFPYTVYLPLVRKVFGAHLRRRETILHKAVRYSRIGIADRVIHARADCCMANINWQTPLHLAILLDYHKDPDLPQTRGSFLGRLFPPSPVFVKEPTKRSSDMERIIAMLEDAQSKTSWRSMSPFRALREVRWPWDEYEADDMGVRFVLFYSSIASFIVLAFLVFSFFFNLIPHIAQIMDDAVEGYAASFVPMAECFKECKANGSDARTVCTSMQLRSVRNLALLREESLYIPTFNELTLSIIDAIDECYDSSKSSRPHTNRTDDYRHLLPGCDMEIMFGASHPWIKGNGSRVNEVRMKFLSEHAKCERSWSGKSRIVSEGF